MSQLSYPFAVKYGRVALSHPSRQPLKLGEAEHYAEQPCIHHWLHWQVAMALCTVLSACLSRIPDALVRSKFVSCSQVIMTVIDHHREQVRPLSLWLLSEHLETLLVETLQRRYLWWHLSPLIQIRQCPGSQTLGLGGLRCEHASCLIGLCIEYVLYSVPFRSQSRQRVRPNVRIPWLLLI